MPLDPEAAWNDAIANLKPDKGPDWAKGFADAIDSCCTGKTELTGVVGKPTFTFNKAIFMAQLMTLAPVPDPVSAAMGFANAWGTAMLASTMIVPPGSALGASAPPTLWSVVITSLIDPPTIELAKAFLIATLPTLEATKDAKQSKTGGTFRSAFLMCTCTVTGLNSLPPPPGGPGPLPFPGLLIPFQ